MTSHCCQEGQPHPHSHQLLNHIIDCQATRRPQALFAEYPISSTSYDGGFMKITYGKLANAINRIAWWLVDTYGHGKLEPLAYIGPNDLTYPALILGATKAGYKMLLLSPRNSIAAQLHLLQVTNCSIFLTPAPVPPPIAAIVDALDETYRVSQVPSVEGLLQPCKSFLYNVSFEEGRHTPLAIMHTSGSTGLPKPITWPQGFVAAYAKQLQLQPPPGYRSIDQLYEANRVCLVFPPFHPNKSHMSLSSGVLALPFTGLSAKERVFHSLTGTQAAWFALGLVNAITNQTAVIYPLKGVVPSAASLAELLQHTKVDTVFVVPTIIEEMSRSPEILEDFARNVDVIVYSGGDVPKSCGDIVASQLPLVDFYGSSEGASLSLIRPESESLGEDWKYLSFHPDSGVEFRHHADDAYELCIVRRPAFEKHQQIFCTFSDLHEWRTSDLFRQHPSKPGLWTHCGRADDTIVFLTGEKVNPVDMETYILSHHPEIMGVLVVGSQRFQAALLVELRHGIRDADVIDSLWQTIESMNLGTPSQARVAKTHIAFIDPKRPMVRSLKGAIQRAATIAEYEKEIELLYRAADELDIDETHCDIQDTESALQCLGAVINTVTGHKLAVDDNFFLNGMDSLQSLLLVREVRRIFAVHLEARTLYAHPSMASLIEALQQRGSLKSSNSTVSSTLEEFSKLINMITHPARPASGRLTPVFLLTGSTGFLGSYILDAIIRLGGRVYCLNRAADADLIQLKRNAARGLSTELSKCTFLTGDLSQPMFGLEEKSYVELQSSATLVIHNAWSVDFNIPLSSYRPQLEGIINLVDFAAAASYRPSLLYISSISAVSHFKGEHTPEKIISDEAAVSPMGYGASKYVAEHLLNNAKARLPLDIQIARVGQIAGPLSGSGQWNQSEWLPSIIISSFEVRAIPSSLGMDLDRIDWIPVDALAAILLELADTRASRTDSSNSTATVFNVVNPQSTSWQELLPAILQSIPAEQQAIPQVSFEEWLQRVRGHFESQARASGPDKLEAILQANPAAKLLGFYEGASVQRSHVWDTTHARESSATLGSLGAIEGRWMQKWMQKWIPQS